MEAVAESQFDNLCCLVVDDDKFSRSFIKTALYQIGIKTIKEAASASEATEILRNFVLIWCCWIRLWMKRPGVNLRQKYAAEKLRTTKTFQLL